MKTAHWPGSPAANHIDLMNTVGTIALGIILAAIFCYAVRELIEQLRVSIAASNRADELAASAEAAHPRTAYVEDRMRTARRRPKANTLTRGGRT